MMKRVFTLSKDSFFIMTDKKNIVTIQNKLENHTDFQAVASRQMNL